MACEMQMNALEVSAWDGDVNDLEQVFGSPAYKGCATPTRAPVVVASVADSTSRPGATSRKRYVELEPLGVWVKRGRLCCESPQGEGVNAADVMPAPARLLNKEASGNGQVLHESSSLAFSCYQEGSEVPAQGPSTPEQVAPISAATPEYAATVSDVYTLHDSSLQALPPADELFPGSHNLLACGHSATWLQPASCHHLSASAMPLVLPTVTTSPPAAFPKTPSSVSESHLPTETSLQADTAHASATSLWHQWSLEDDDDVLPDMCALTNGLDALPPPPPTPAVVSAAGSTLLESLARCITALAVNASSGFGQHMTLPGVATALLQSTSPFAIVAPELAASSLTGQPSTL